MASSLSAEVCVILYPCAGAVPVPDADPSVVPDGLGMLREIFDAPGTLKLSVGRLELQRDVSRCLPRASINYELNFT
jgi:hypothetical protein